MKFGYPTLVEPSTELASLIAGTTAGSVIGVVDAQ
jgi:hypothetical protein